MGEITKALKIEEIARACGADQLEVINVYNIQELIDKIKNMYQQNGVSVLVAKGECRLLTVRKMAKAGAKVPKFEIISQSGELENLQKFGCPAIRKDNEKIYIDENMCWGCAVCGQLFPGQIKFKKAKE